MKTVHVLKTVLCAALLIVACSKTTEETAESAETAVAKSTPTAAGTPAAGTIKQPDPCSLLTVEQAKEILGNSVKTGEGSDSAIQRDCTWSGTDNLTDMIVVEVRAASSYASAHSIASQMPEKPEDIAGVGDQAFYGTMGHVMKNVVFTKGGTYVQITVSGAKDAESKARLIAAAKAMASRL